MLRRLTLILLIGLTVTLTNPIWAATEEVWRQLTPAGTPPSPRQSYTAVLDSRNHRMLVFGGWNNGTVYNDIWSLDLTAGSERWAQLTTTGTPPSPRSSQTGIYVPTNHSLIISCGADANEPLYDTWILNLDSLQWKRLYIAGPDRRWAPACVYDSWGNRALLFGGIDWQGFPINETYYLTKQSGLAVWQIFNSTGSPPSRRSSMASAFDPKTGKMIVFGGYWFDGSDHFYNDSYLFDPNQGQGVWTQLSPGGNVPSLRREVSGICDTLNNRFLIFGGGTRSSAYNDVYALDLTTNTWTQLSPSGTLPSPRYCTQVVYDTPNRRMILFGGGYPGGSVYNDCWELGLPPSGVESGIYDESSGLKMISVHPNPASGQVRFSIYAPRPSKTILKVFDVTGRSIRTQSEDIPNQGLHQVVWDGNREDGRSCPSGVYFYELSTGEQTFRGKITKTR